MEKNSFTQYGDQSKPVRHLIHLSQEITKRIEEYAQNNNISEGDVHRKAMEAFLDSHGMTKRTRHAPNPSRTRRVKP